VLFNNRAFHSKLISTTVRDATYVLDGLLYHESNLRFVEHYTDTAGFADHVFAMMHLLGFRFAPSNTESERNEVVLDRRAWFLSRF
jgi:TnpA family transposase